MSVGPVQIKLPKAWAQPVVLPDTKDGVPVTNIQTPLTTKTFEAVGEWIQKSLWACEVKKQIDPIVSADGSLSKTAGGGAARNKERRKAGGVKLKDEDIAEDFYEILGLTEEEVVTMSADDFKNVFRKRCIETHPDKMPNQDDTLFKKVKRGYEIMIDEDSRRAYDSSRLFDDSIPKDTEYPTEKFYSTFAPVFDRNKKFSMDLPLPSIGDADTPMKDVRRFYDCWYRFRSWRDFSSSCKDLEDIHEEMERDQKRHLQRKNQAKLSGMMKDEMTRIRNLVDRAQKHDPRIIAEREAEVAAQEKIKAERGAERERLREQAAREKQDAIDREKKAAEDKVTKEKNDKEAAKELRLSLITFFADNSMLDKSASNMLADDEVKQKNINWLTSKRDTDQLRAIVEEISSKSTKVGKDGKVEAVICFNNVITATEESVGQNRYGEAIKTAKQKQEEEEKKKAAEAAAAEAKAAKKNGPKWEDDELILLSKAIAKYPPGTVDRWRRMITMLPDQKKFSEEQILKKVKEVESGWKGGADTMGALGVQKAPELGSKRDDADGWKDDPSAKAWAVGTTHPGAGAPSSVPVAPLKCPFKVRLGRMLAKWCPEKLDMLDQMVQKYAHKEDEFMEALVNKFGPEPELPTAPTVRKHADPNAPKTAGGGAAPKAASGAKAAAGAPALGVEDWTEGQQKKLEEGLRAQKDNKAKDKYVLIAAGVEGKTAKQCFDRFKYLCSLKK